MLMRRRTRAWTGDGEIQLDDAQLAELETADLWHHARLLPMLPASAAATRGSRRYQGKLALAGVREISPGR